jgi:DNA-binding transcriptional LysR family regulator
MHEIDLKALDLNLLITLDALLSAGSVTAAARSLGRSQSAVSHSLQRLRDALGDPLLVRSGRGMVPTPRAQALGPSLRRALDELRRLLSEEGVFDPARSERIFTVAAPDVMAIFLPQLLAAIRAEAPGVRLALRAPLRGDPSPELAGGRVDLALAPARSAPPGLVATRLGQVTQAVLVREGHPILTGPWDAARFVSWPHVQIITGDGLPSLVSRAVAAAGLERTVGVTVPSFMLAPYVVSQTDMLFTAPRELVAGLAASMGLRLLEPPLPLPAIDVVVMWHPRSQADAGHRWLRRLLSEEVRRLLAGP